MLKMCTRWQLVFLLGTMVALFMPATSRAQRRRTSAPRTQTAAPTQPPTQAKPGGTPAVMPPQAPVTSQKTAPAVVPAAAQKNTKGTWRLKVANASPRLLSLKSDRALVADIAAELGRKLDVPIILSPIMAKARVTLEFTGTPLEGALRMIAPVPYVDYEVSGDGSLPPKIIALYLYGLNEPPPAESAAVRGDSEALLIEGNTEDGTEAESEKDKQEKALNVKVERYQVTVHARKQPLTAILFEIANKVDIPFEMKYDSNEIVDIDLTNATMEQVVHTLSPNIRLYQRTDLQTFETRPLRIVLAMPASAQGPNKM